MGEHGKKSNIQYVLITIIAIILLAVIGIYFGMNGFPNQKEENQININKQTSNEILNQEIENNNQIANNESTNQINSPEIEETVTELFEKYYDKAEERLSTMTLEEKVGQMFLARYPEKDVVKEIKSENPGGYVLFGRDFKNETKKSIQKELKECQETSKIGLFLGVDEEGGTVVRVSAYSAFRSTKFQSPQNLWSKGQLPLILKDSTEKSKLLQSLGLNMNLAPVADVPTKSSSFIYARSYGRGAEKTAIYVSELIKTMNQDNMISTMKHFPGYGDNIDTHTGIAIDKREYATFEKSDFLPFKSGIEASGPTILVSHNIVKSMDENKPASLSEKVHEILRKELKFSGIIMTDDLAMDAVKKYVENGEAAVQAIKAGNDMIISSNFVKQKEEIMNAIKKGKLDEELINIAVKRILACKYAYGII